MKTAQAIREGITASRTEIEAVVAIATEEDRELSEEEQTLVDEKLESIAKEEKTLATREKIDSQIKAQAAAPLNEQIDRQLSQREHADNPVAQITLPAKAKAHGNLKAYTGPNAEKNAFVAGQLMLANLFNNGRAQQWCVDHGLVRGELSSSDNTKGGFFITDEMSREIIRLREERGVFPRFANNQVMASDVMKANRLLGDVTVYAVGEGKEITKSDITVGQMEVMARKIGALTTMPSEVDEDSVVDLGDQVTQSMAYAMADKIDEAGFNGDGTSTYVNVVGLKNALNSSAIVDAASGNTGAKTLDLADFENTIAAYPQYSAASPRWFVHSAVYWTSMARLQLAAGGNTVQDLGNGPTPMFMGYPVEFVQVMPSTTGASASTILAYFGDLRLGATFGTRRSARTEVSVDRYFENDLIAIKMTERWGITIHERGDTIRTRPIVALKTAAS